MSAQKPDVVIEWPEIVMARLILIVQAVLWIAAIGASLWKHDTDVIKVAVVIVILNVAGLFMLRGKRS